MLTDRDSYKQKKNWAKKQQQQKTTCINLHQHVVVNLKSKLEFIFADTLKILILHF